MTEKEKFLKLCLVLDTETTGKDYKIAEVIELGYVIRNENSSWLAFDELYKPREPISPGCSAVCNITNKMVEHKLYYEDCSGFITQFVEEFEADRTVFVAHNAFYDREVLKRYGVTFPNELCTLRMAKKLYGDDLTVEAVNLPYLRYRFEIDLPPTVACHRADSDALITGMLLDKFIDEMELRGILDTTLPYWPQIYDWINKPTIFDTMPFGKWKGTKLTEVPMNYWNWALKNMTSLDEDADDYDADFATSVAIALEKKMS